MPTPFDPEQAVSTGLLGAAGPVQVTISGAAVDFFDYTKKDGTVTARTCAALIGMSPDGEVDDKGNPKVYQQMYSIGDPKTHHPNPDHATFEGPLVKGSNFNFFLENLINAGFPKHLLMAGDVRVLNGAVLVVEQKKPPSRNIAGKADDSANKAQVVPVKVLHPAPGEDWPATGKAVSATTTKTTKPAAGSKKLTAAPATKAAAPAPTIPAAEDLTPLGEAIVTELITEAGDTGFETKDLGKKATFKYMKKMQSDKETFPANQRANVVALVQNPEWLGDAARPWAFDAETGILVGGV